MSDGVSTVTVELLRAGPPHNQLLSPLTQYLGVCGEYAAGIVTLPYEHATFQRRLQELRYEAGTDEDPARRAGILADVGVDMARILGTIPGLSVSLSGEAGESDQLVHLRVVISASELALLPLELSKVPTGAQGPSDSWLALQAHVPVCLTRHVRSVPITRRSWPTRPRILFVAGDIADLPFAKHEAVLRQVTKRWIKPNEAPREIDGKAEPLGSQPDDGDGDGDTAPAIEESDVLTILRNASLADVAREMRAGRYTHVHVLAHGADDDTRDGLAFGIELLAEDEGDPGFTDVVSGERFANAVAGRVTEGIHPPAVITVASCDSAQQGSIESPGGSFVHALHSAGIPLVIGSQFPLSEAGSITMTERLYEGLLWGDSPWRLLTDLRRDLHGQYAVDSHDWASLVVYEALPPDLDSQLAKVRYRQGREAVNAALARVDDFVDHDPPRPLSQRQRDELTKAVEEARRRLPTAGPYAMEGFGLRASSRKRQAHGEWRASQADDATDEQRRASYRECYRLLNDAFDDYRQATRGFLVNTGEPMQREASLHWVLVQMVSMGGILGRPIEEEAWITAKMSADLYLDHESVEERAWAHGSLAELWLLKLLADEENRDPPGERVHEHVKGLLRLYPRKDAFVIRSTRRQFARYADWWSKPDFSAALRLERRASWDDVKAVADEIVRLLDPPNWRAEPPKRGDQTPV